MFAGRFSPSTGLVGIDFGADHVRLLQVREQGGDLKVIGAALEETPRLIDGSLDAARMAQRLRAAMASGGFTGRRCVVSVPRSAVRVQSVRLPKMPAAEVRQAVVWEAAQRFELDRSAMEVDHIATGATLGSDQRDELLLIAAEHAAYMPHLHAVIEAGLRPIAAETNFCALARIFSRRTRRESDRGVVRAIVEVGRSGATIMVLRGDQIAFCKPLELSGRAFDRAAAEHLGIDLQAAAEIRAGRIAEAARDGANYVPEDPATDRAVYEAVRPLIRELAKEVTLCMRYYGVTFRGQPPECVILTGCDGIEPHLARILQMSCKVPVRIDDVVGTLDSLLPQIRAAMNRVPGPAACWATAAGLSLRRSGARSNWDRRGSAAATASPQPAVAAARRSS